MKQDFKTMWVIRKDENTHQLIKSHRFNPELHKKLVLKNLIKEITEKLSRVRVDINNPWLVTIGGVILTIVLSVIFLT